VLGNPLPGTVAASRRTRYREGVKSVAISIVATIVLIAGGLAATHFFGVRLTTFHWIAISVIATILLNIGFRRRGQ
jgi:predicted exporter